MTKKIGYLAAIAAPILCFYAILAHYLINIPLGDDYETVLPFMARIATMDWLHRLGYIFEFQHNEYSSSSKTRYSRFIRCPWAP